MQAHGKGVVAEDCGGGAAAAAASASAAARISDADVASVVLSYLSSEGFDRAAAAFRR